MDPARRTRRTLGAGTDALFRVIRLREAGQAVRTFRHWIPCGGRVLDLGCGRGYVGALLERERACRTIGCDVVPANEALRRFCLFDGRSLPFRAGAFDASILAFILHHATDPRELLAEVARVTRGSILVLEDTPRRRPDRWWGRIHVRSFNHRHALPDGGRVRSELEWRSLFARAGLRVARAERIRRRERFPPVARSLFVLRPER